MYYRIVLRYHISPANEASIIGSESDSIYECSRVAPVSLRVQNKPIISLVLGHPDSTGTVT
jgi:hypothetical protein